MTASSISSISSSLVTTNDHLLKKLEEEKKRHKQEIAQMCINYEQLRKTIDFMK